MAGWTTGACAGAACAGAACSAAFLRWRPGWLGDVPGLEAIRSPLRADLRAARSLLACSTNRGAVRQLPLLASQLKVPSLWIVGSRDSVMQPRYVRHLAGYSPRHRLELLEGAGHLPMRQQPAVLAACIETWLQQDVLASDRTPGRESATAA